jgi:hypothetical protein
MVTCSSAYRDGDLAAWKYEQRRIEVDLPSAAIPTRLAVTLALVTEATSCTV